MINIKPEGILAIQNFLIANHKNGYQFEGDKGEPVKMLAEWLRDAEDSYHEGREAMIEIPGINSRTGNPITFTIGPDMYDEIESEFSIVISNIGTISHGLKNEKLSYDEYYDWVSSSKQSHGRVAGENVTLFKNGEIIEEHIGYLHNMGN